MGDTKHGPGLPGVGGTDGFGGYGRSFLTDGVGRGQANEPDDVLRASSFLAENGLQSRPTREADEGFLRAVQRGQARLNELAGGGLDIDGVVGRWGPTEVLSQRAVSSGRMKPPKVEPGPYNWFSGEPPEEPVPDDPIDVMFQKLNRWLYRMRGERVPFMGKSPVGGVRNRNRG